MIDEQAPSKCKAEVRQRILAGRATRSANERRAAGEALAVRVLALPEIQVTTTVACYASTPEEPDTGPLLTGLSVLGQRVLLPLLRPDFDLDWAAHQRGDLASGRFGISEPTGEPLGLDAIRSAAVMVCPGLAADELGHRLGRGGGSYDRALARLPAGALRVVLLYDDEVLGAVPTDPHDERVDVIVTPRTTLRTLPDRA